MLLKALALIFFLPSFYLFTFVGIVLCCASSEKRDDTVGKNPALRPARLLAAFMAYGAAMISLYTVLAAFDIV